MAHLDLTPDELQMLVDSLTSYLTELRRELAGTEDRDAQRALAQREEFLSAMLQRLKAPRAA